MKKLFAVTACCFGLILAFGILNAQPARQTMGKFYIVGMGTAPDLITVRAQRVVARADVVLFEEGSEGPEWADFLKGKEIWRWPHSFRKSYGVDPKSLKDPAQRANAERMDALRRELAHKIQSAVEQGKTVACLENGDPMMYGMTLFLEMLSPDLPSEIVPGIGSFQAASAAVKMSPPYGFDTSAVILTMNDWPGRVDTNEKLMATGSTMVFYTMGLDYPSLFSQLKRHYPTHTPIAVVIDAGDLMSQKVIRSTVGRFLEEVDYKNLPDERHLLLIGKFLKMGQARKDFLLPHNPTSGPPQ
jgi:precorrin-4 methylase